MRARVSVYVCVCVCVCVSMHVCVCACARACRKSCNFVVRTTKIASLCVERVFWRDFNFFNSIPAQKSNFKKIYFRKKEKISSRRERFAICLCLEIMIVMMISVLSLLNWQEFWRQIAVTNTYLPTFCMSSKKLLRKKLFLSGKTLLSYIIYKMFFFYVWMVVFLRTIIRLCGLFEVRHVMGAIIMTFIEHKEERFRHSRVSNPGRLDQELSAITVQPRRQPIQWAF